MYGALTMAKKKNVMGMTDNQPGAEEAKSALAQSNLNSLPEKLKRDLAVTGGDLRSYLRDAFGVESDVKEVTWELNSGSKATFIEANLTYDQVKSDTYVDFSINGRDQEYLNAQNLDDLSTMQFQQFYPAIATRKNGKISLLDGSRRRAYFLLQEGKITEFSVLISDDDISHSDAKNLAKSIQTAKEHNLYELGKRCLTIKKSTDVTQQEIAEALCISQSRVSKAMKAAAISSELYSLFHDINDLSGSDYAELARFDARILQDADKTLALEGVERGEVENVMGQLRRLMKEAQPVKTKAIVSHMARYDDKKKMAKKSVHPSTRKTTYEFQRLSAAEQTMIDEAIEAVFLKMKDK